MGTQEQITNAQIYPVLTTCVNVAILVSLAMSFVKHHKGREKDINFHTRMLLMCTCLLIANTFALLTGIYSYFILKSNIPEIINFGRFADRYCMFFAYIALDKIDER